MKLTSSLARFFQKEVGIRFFFTWFEVRFFNFATNKANCDWLTLILNMARSNQSNYQNKTINTQIVAALRSQQVQELEDYINITYDILDNILQILDTENVPVMQIIPCLAILSKKLKMILSTLSKKPDDFMRETKNYLKKTQMTLKNYIVIS